MPIFQETSTCSFLKPETLKILVLFQMVSQKKFLDEMGKKEREKSNKGTKKKGSVGLKTMISVITMITK